jgi:hypothetical protein
MDLREKKKEYNKLYRQNNLEKLKLYGAEYNRINCEKIKQYKQINAAKYNAYLAEQITCNCKAVIARGGFARHKRTNKHIENMKKMIDT